MTRSLKCKKHTHKKLYIKNDHRTITKTIRCGKLKLAHIRMALLANKNKTFILYEIYKRLCVAGNYFTKIL